MREKGEVERGGGGGGTLLARIPDAQQLHEYYDEGEEARPESIFTKKSHQLLQIISPRRSGDSGSLTPIAPTRPPPLRAQISAA